MQKQQLILKRVKKKEFLPIKPIPIKQMKLNGMYFDLLLDKMDRYYLRGNNKIYQIVNKIEE